MQVSIVGVLPNLVFNYAFKRIKISRFNLEKAGSQISHLKYQRVQESLGTFRTKDAEKFPCFYVTYNSNTPFDLSEELQMFRGIFNRILYSLWLVKDNSIYLDFLYGITEMSISENKANKTFTNAKGIFNENTFSKEELKEAEEWFKRIKSDGIDTAEHKRTSHNVRGIITHTEKNLGNTLNSRLDRAQRFILTARGESFLHAKITFYISAMEALLSTTNVEVRMQVADRGARLLGDSFEERVRINKVITAAYSFRSNYIHGSATTEKSVKNTLKPNFETVEELSSEVDEVLRRLLKRFHTDLHEVSDYDNKKFAEWVNDLLYR